MALLCTPCKTGKESVLFRVPGGNIFLKTGNKTKDTGVEHHPSIEWGEGRRSSASALVRDHGMSSQINRDHVKARLGQACDSSLMEPYSQLVLVDSNA